VVFELLEELNERPEACLFVGDSRVDIETGHRAGIPVCAVTWGFRARETLQEAEFLADTVEELQEMILRA
jgi:phosphoglycolate phosphatase